MLTIRTTSYEPLIDEQNDKIITDQYEDIVVEGGTGWRPLQDDEYYITQKANGADTLTFSISIYDPIYPVIEELNQVRDSDGTQYLVQKVDAGDSTAKVVCALDLDDWKAAFYPSYNSGSNTAYTIINAIKPSGWSVLDRSGISVRRTLEGDYTPYDIVQECLNTFKAYVRFDNVAKTVTIYNTEAPQPIGAFASRQLNLQEINYKGDAQKVITRLYPYGADGMSIASVNGGIPYVENNSYYGKTISAVWRDDRYTDPQSLMDDAVSTLETLAMPERSYQCKVIDLARIDNKYSNQDFSLFASILLADDIRGTSTAYQIVEKRLYPHYPEKNAVTLSTVPAKIQSQVMRIEAAIDNPNSTFRQIMAAQAENATNWLTSANGYVVFVEEDNACKEILFLDTPDIATARNVLRINTNGLGFSTTGINGPYTNAWTIDGNLVADFITTGTMLADRIQGGSLSLGGLANEDGIIIMYDASGNEIGRWDNSGLNVSSGTFTYTNGQTALQIASGGLTSNVGDEWLEIYESVIRSGYGDTRHGELDLSAQYPNDEFRVVLQSENGAKLYLVSADDAEVYAAGDVLITAGANHYVRKYAGGRTSSVVGSTGTADTDAINFIYQSSNSGTYYIGFTPYSGTTRFAVVTTSDKKLKKNIKTSKANGVETIKAIKHKSFDFKEDGAHRDCGYIAQQLQEVIPEAVLAAPEMDAEGNKTGETLQIVDHEVLTYATKAIQELAARVEALEAQLGVK